MAQDQEEGVAMVVEAVVVVVTEVEAAVGDTEIMAVETDRTISRLSCIMFPPYHVCL